MHALDKSKELNATILNKNDTLYDLEATLEERQNYLEVVNQAYGEKPLEKEEEEQKEEKDDEENETENAEL